MYIQNTFARRGHHDEMIAQLDALNMHRRGDSWKGHSATSKTTTPWPIFLELIPSFHQQSEAHEATVEISPSRLENESGGGGGSRTRVRKCYWSRAYMRSPVHAPGITLGRSRPALRTDKKRKSLA